MSKKLMMMIVMAGVAFMPATRAAGFFGWLATVAVLRGGNELFRGHYEPPMKFDKCLWWGTAIYGGICVLDAAARYAQVKAEQNRRLAALEQKDQERTEQWKNFGPEVLVNKINELTGKIEHHRIRLDGRINTVQGVLNDYWQATGKAEQFTFGEKVPPTYAAAIYTRPTPSAPPAE